ncbi:acetamidase/formamidase family protein [Nocardia abscessus]|uniref:acetamidase/formamidase family protein n=1 Tax=Nocardia abscessus TaxID=120957 RepID=UPI002456C2D4|nr:acetamidase/formamidase family protein [Nocardia abscessus]
MTRPTTHYLSKESHHDKFDNSLEPALTIDSGDTVVFECVEASGNQVTRESTVEDLKVLDWDKFHRLTGPVAVRGAEPGDVLKIEILDFEHEGWAWTCIAPEYGVLAEEFGDTHALRVWEVGADERVELTPGIRVPVAPFMGVMGVALAEPGAHSTLPPRSMGGNLDSRHLVKGSTLLLPVQVPGALFSTGDGHLGQGDGEVCIAALEGPLTVTLRISVVKGRSIRAPQFITYAPTTSKVDGMGYYVTGAAGLDLQDGVRRAVSDMIEYLQAEYGLNRIDAYMLCSVAGDLKIAVPVLGPGHASFVTFHMPRSIFAG